VFGANFRESQMFGLCRDCVQFCSRLIDLVVGVGTHGSSGHVFAAASEGFVGFVAKGSAQAVDC
jgi:hypothetical protein